MVARGLLPAAGARIHAWDRDGHHEPVDLETCAHFEVRLR